ncbi:hypothetical protein RQP46_006109 [Phenoliferia psychrophenolica]
MAPPRIPPELITDIIELTVELLIEEERHLDAHAPLSNRFLLSAALVDHTWNAIATPLLLKRGIVTSGSVPGFLAQIKAYGMEASVKCVRYGEAAKSGDDSDRAIESLALVWATEKATKEDTAFNLLVESLSGLADIELVESGHSLHTALLAGRKFNRAHLLNYDISRDGFGVKFKNCPPAQLIVTETRRHSSDSDSEADYSMTFELVASFSLFIKVETLNIRTQAYPWSHYFSLLVLIGERGQPILRTCDFDYPHLENLTTYLLAAYFLLMRGIQPRLTSLEILPDPPGLPSSMVTIETLAETKLLELVDALPVLENLKVPASWASDALREACGGKGVTLLST